MASPDPLGKQQARVRHVPEFVSSSGQEAIELCAMAGLHLDAWQQDILTAGLGERPDGSWSAFEVGVCVARQNGKGGVEEARELAGLYLLGERLIIHSAHQFDTSLEAFRRLLALIEDTPELDRRVKRVSRSHGEEGIELKGGQRIRFRTRTKGGGRGFTCDCLILDEAMFVPEATHGALLPTLSARPNPQVWYAGSAVDENVHPDGVVFTRVRARGVKGDDPRLAYFEWSLDYPNPESVPEHVTADPELWTIANPGMGIRISQEHIEAERRSMDPVTFAVERLGVGRWPLLDGEGSVINLEKWRNLTDLSSSIGGPVCFAYDVTPDRSSAAIAAAGLNPDGHLHVEIVERRPGTGWLVSRLSDLARTHSPEAVVCDSIGPGASLVTELEQAGVRVSTVNGREHANACGLLYDLVEQSKLRHLGTPELGNAVRGAGKRPLGDAWLWSRRHSSVDISPLVAVTLAAWQASSAQESVYERRGLLVLG